MHWLTAHVRLLAVITALAAGVVLASTVAFAARPGVAQQLVPQGGFQCRLSTDPLEPLELNTVSASQLFKTIAMEKEIFLCADGAGPATQIRDFETFIEIVQDREGKLRPIRVELAICFKSLIDRNIVCRNADVALGASTPTPLEGCIPESHQVPRDPVEMTSAVSGGVVKTIKVEKEIFRCDTPNGIVTRDIYLFTELMERPTTQPGAATTFSVFLRRFIGISCDKNVEQGTIIGCRRFRTAP